MTAAPVILTVYFLMLLALAGWSIWLAAERLRDYFMLAFVTLALVPLLATTISGDVSRFLPAASFSTGAEGKDQVIIASVLTTLLLGAIVAALMLRAARAFWRKLRAGDEG